MGVSFIQFRNNPEFPKPIKVMKEESMKKNTALKIVNPIMGVLLINQVLVAFLHDLLPKEVFEFLHEGGGVVFAVAAILHVTLNWNWIKMNFLQKASKKDA